MAKKHGKRYTDAERAAILADMERSGLTQVAAAKKHGVSAVTIWAWAKAAKTTKRHSKVHHPALSNGSLAAMVRTEVQVRVRELVPLIIHEEIARSLGSKR